MKHTILLGLIGFLPPQWFCCENSVGVELAHMHPYVETYLHNILAILKCKAQFPLVVLNVFKIHFFPCFLYHRGVWW